MQVQYTLLDEYRNFYPVSFRHQFQFVVPVEIRRNLRAQEDLMLEIYTLTSDLFGPGHRGMKSGEMHKVENRWIYWNFTIRIKDPNDAMLYRLSV